MQDKPHIAAHKIKGGQRINACGLFANLITISPYNSPHLRVLPAFKRKQLID